MADHARQPSQFDQFAGNYRDLHNASIGISGETGEYFAEYKAKFIAKIAGKNAPKILDYGCGIGLVCSGLKKHLPVARIDGFDVSQASLDQINPVLRMQGAFVTRTSELHDPYDVVFMANVLHHVQPQERRNAVSEAARLLRSGGKFIVFEHNPKNPLTRRAVERCPFDENVILLSTRETTGYLVDAGLCRIQVQYIVFFPRVFSWLRPLEGTLGWCPAGAQYALMGTRI